MRRTRKKHNGALIRERAQRRALVEREKLALTVSQRCRLLAVSRSS